MGLTKTELFTEEQNELAQVNKALAHPARIAIIQHILKSEQCINGDLVEELGLAQPTISQHLKELKQVGIIKGNIEGTSMNYCIDKDKWKYIRSLLVDLFDQAQLSDSDDCC
tara:strand:- start:342 stop:677 length:336 start_codon:yes stop_codon:yes gene_type:complete